MHKVRNDSEITKQALSSLKLLETDSDFGKSFTDEEREAFSYVQNRFVDMDSKRSTIDRNWPTYIKQYEALWTPYKDGRSSSNVPLERAIIELFVAEALKRKTRFNVKADSAEQNAKLKTAVFDKVWKHDWRTEKRENVINDNEYITATFGTSVIYTGFQLSSRIISDPVQDEEGNFTWVRKKETKGRIILENADIRNFWIDDHAKTIDEASDCIYVQYIPQEEFDSFAEDKQFKNIDKIKARFYLNQQKDVFRVREERGENARYVKLVHYWNKYKDSYVVIANDCVIIRNHPIFNASHSLPFVMRQFGKNMWSAYGYGLAEALMTFKSDINTLREMLMDAVKRSNSQTVAIGNNLTFDNNQGFSYNDSVMTFNGNLAGNFQQISGNPPNQAIFSYIERLYKDVAIFCGIDIQNILGEAQQTAYQTAVQKESSLKRVNVILTNRDAAFERLADLHKDNLQMFFTRKMVRGLVEIGANGKPVGETIGTLPQVEVEGEKLNRERGRFDKSEIDTVFELEPEDIRGKFKIDVYTDLNTPTINEVEKAQKMEFLQQIPNIVTAYQASPELENILPIKKTLKDMAESFNIDTSIGSDQDVQEQRAKLFSEVQGLASKFSEPTNMMNSPQGTEAPVMA